jgi:isopentenyl diphosphate isomerase/L-lactate dehydrogenase-like FMN-dependent dehydrogenase
MAGLRKTASIGDLRALARRRLPAFAFTYFDEGAGDDGGVERNERAFARRLFQIRRLRGAVGSTGVSVFGRSYGQPFGAAPVGLANLAWPGTDLAIARLAEREKIPYVLSTAATTDIEAVAAAAPTMAWFQLYPANDRAITEDLLCRAERAGIDVLVLTIDVPRSPLRHRSIRAGVSLPFRYTPQVIVDLAMHPRWALATLAAGSPSLSNYAPYLRTAKIEYAGRMMAQVNKHGLTWDDLAAVRARWRGRLVVKGIMSAEDAGSAVAAGADAIWVSNHGGRQLESSPSSLDVLADVRAALGASMPIFFDSGIRGGEDVVKALALGADMAFCGRAFIYGAAAGGAAGVKRAFDILAGQVTNTLGQIGCLSAVEARSAALIPERRGGSVADIEEG